MAKKKTDLSEFEDLFKDIKTSSEEVENLLKQAKEEVVETGETTLLAKDEETAPVFAELTNYAFGIHKNEKTGQWCVAEIRFNAQTNKCEITNDAVITNLSKAVINARATELLARVALGLTLKNIKGYKK